MYEQVEKPKDKKNRAAANSVAQKKSNVKTNFWICGQSTCDYFTTKDTQQPSNHFYESDFMD